MKKFGLVVGLFGKPVYFSTIKERNKHIKTLKRLRVSYSTFRKK